MQIRPYQEGDELGVVILDDLLELHPWNRRNLENWRWKFKGENPAGDSLNYVAEFEGELVSYFAVIPMRYWINEEKIRGSHSIAMMVKPEWQNRGLIKYVADQLLREVDNQNISFTYGFPNDNAYELHVKHLGYSDISMQVSFEKIMPLDIEVNLNHFSSTLKFQQIESFDEAADHLWEEAKEYFKVIVIRNANFLNWRYIARPDVPYFAYGAYNQGKLVGYCILKLYREDQLLRGHFIDLFTIPGKQEYGRFLVQNGLEFFKKARVSEVTLWMQGSLFFQEILEEYGFKEGTSRPMICRFSLEPDKFKPILTKDNWYFTMGDTLEIY